MPSQPACCTSCAYNIRERATPTSLELVCLVCHASKAFHHACVSIPPHTGTSIHLGSQRLRYAMKPAVPCAACMHSECIPAGQPAPGHTAPAVERPHQPEAYQHHRQQTDRQSATWVGPTRDVRGVADLHLKRDEPAHQLPAQTRTSCLAV
jgi:hypothetical protein